MKITEHRMAEMWCELNRFILPPELSNCMENAQDRKQVIPVMRFIEVIIGLDNCLKEWNKDDKRPSNRS